MALSKHDPTNESASQYNGENTSINPIRKDRTTQQSDESLNDEEIRQGKESYLRDSGNIEDLRGTGGDPVEENSTHLTDESGEEEKEEYINTDERKKDLDKNTRNGL